MKNPQMTGMKMEEEKPVLRRSSRLRATKEVEVPVPPTSPISVNEDFEDEWKEDSSNDSCSNNSEDDDDNISERGAAGSSKRRKIIRKRPFSGGGIVNLDNLKCDKCPTHFKTEKTLQWHMDNVHGGDKCFTCPVCGRMFNKLLALFSHVKRHENAEDCEEGFDLWNTWPRPKNSNRKANSIQFSCKYCLFPHSSNQAFLSHMASHHPDKDKHTKFTCTYCNKLSQEYKTIKSLMVHIRSEHYQEYHRSEIKTVAGWSQPLNRSRLRPKAYCEFCHKLMDAWSMKGHVRRQHSSSSSSNAKTKHPPVKDSKMSTFACPVSTCTSRVKTAQQLKQHFFLHLENNPYACPVPGCKVKCDARCHLKRHLKLHQGDFHECQKCGVSYARMDKLRNHACSENRKLRQDDLNGVVRPLAGNLRLERLPKEIKKKLPDFTKPERSADINAIIRSDPAFIQACKDCPEFGELIGVDKEMKGYINAKRKKGVSGRKSKECSCSDCGKILVSISSLRRHWLLIHGVTNPTILPKVGASGSNSRKGRKKMLRKKTIPATSNKARPGVSVSHKTSEELDQNPSVVSIKVEPELNIAADGNFQKAERLELSSLRVLDDPVFVKEEGDVKIEDMEGILIIPDIL